MINISFFYSKKKIITGFKAGGHSEFYNKPFFKIRNFFLKKKQIFRSKDYICSAVSAVSYMTAIGLTEVNKKKTRFKTNDSGFMECILKEAPDDKSSLLFSAMLETLKRIDKEYPGHLKILTEEDNGS